MREAVRQQVNDSLARPIPRFTRRDVHVPGIPGKAIAVVGMRRSGKTTFLWQSLADRVASGSARDDLLYFGFDDERLAGMQARDLDLIAQEYFAANPGARGARDVTWLLDEIQLVPGWEAFVRRLLDTERIHVHLSGSSARMLSREVASSLRGRAMEALVTPFSFREALRHTGTSIGEMPERWTSAERSTIAARFRTYLVEGGFPEAQGAEARDRVELLRAYVDAVLLRDVVERHSVSQPLALRYLARRLLSAPASAFSVNRFRRDLSSQGIAVGKDTLYAYLSHLEDAFLFRLAPVATESERRRMSNPRKAYPADQGLIHAFNRSGRPNLGHALETAVLHELDRRGAEVAYVKSQDGSEVDFLARYWDGREELVQVAADIEGPDTSAREIRGLHSAMVDYPRAEALLIVLDRPGVPLDVPGVRVIEAADWMLSPSAPVG